MDEQKDIDSKILKVLNGMASEEDRNFVEQWIQVSKANEFQYQKLKLIWEGTTQDSRLIGHEEQKKKIWNAYSSEIRIPRQLPCVPLYRRAWFRVAVVLLIILFPIYSLYFQDGETALEETPELRMITKSNPTGQKSLIQLPDGSKVWLNSESSISYQEHFSESIRSIHLEGEAYFDVVRDSLRPFVVDFESLSVSVLGTEFNISAFEADKDLRVTLVDGSVKVSNLSLNDSLILSPGTGLVFSKNNNRYNEFSKKDNPELFHRTTEWRNGKLIFDGRNFEEFIREIKRWYGVQVHVQGNPSKGWNIRASFENELLTNVMDAVSYNKGFSYKLKDKELTIMFN